MNYISKILFIFLIFFVVNSKIFANFELEYSELENSKIPNHTLTVKLGPNLSYFKVINNEQNYKAFGFGYTALVGFNLYLSRILFLNFHLGLNSILPKIKHYYDNERVFPIHSILLDTIISFPIDLGFYFGVGPVFYFNTSVPVSSFTVDFLIAFEGGYFYKVTEKFSLNSAIRFSYKLTNSIWKGASTVPHFELSLIFGIGITLF